MLIYRAALWFYGRLIWLASFFNRKAKLFVTGRKHFFRDRVPVRTDKKRIWFHCASLGEFEQARPLIERFSKESHYIIVSFFSPSGYEIRKNYAYADTICYLPLDNPLNARRWYRYFAPQLIFFVKYEFWYFYIAEAKRKNIPIYLISAVFREEQLFFRSYGTMFRNLLASFTAIFVQDEKSLQVLKTVRNKGVYLAGDTRFDRVLSTRQQIRDFPQIDEFKGTARLLILGSSWEPEERLAADFMEEFPGRLKLVIAPHDTSEARISSIRELFKGKIVLYSEASAHNLRTADVMIIDSIGLLSSLYARADYAVVGGGFGSKGLHNILEPAVFGIPVFYGPAIEKFYEAVELVVAGGGFQVDNYQEFRSKLLILLDDQALYAKACEAARIFCEQRAGATSKILDIIGHS